jgi:hypothetical protein
MAQVSQRESDMATFWSAIVDMSRTPSPGPRPTKKTKPTVENGDGAGDRQAAFALPEEQALDEAFFDQMLADDGWLDQDTTGFIDPLSVNGTPDSFTLPLGSTDEAIQELFSPMASSVMGPRQRKMQTGCIPCLIKGKPCDPRDPECRRAMSSDWNLNYTKGDDDDEFEAYPTPESMALSCYRPDMKWRRSWRERHSLNFFVNFSAPQMAGFFDSTFWQKMVIQMSYHEPAILHAITAIGALHEAIMQRAFADEKRKAQAMEFALNQCNRAISSLTGPKRGRHGVRSPDSRLALMTCVLFTCFEAMQGRCDSAVNHALQGRRLLQATGRPNITTMAPSDEDDLEQMRPLVERLEVQATALLDKGKRPETDTSDQTAPLPPIEYIYSLDHAHNTLHTALNSVMRFMQGFHPTAPRDHIAVTIAEKYVRYAPWFQHWEQAFTTFLSDQREMMTNMDLKRAMVLKANHLVGTMLASVDQSAGPVAYDAYEAEFKAIVDLSREVLASFSCPPLPTLSGGTSGTPYLSFSLWVTDPLWMAISRCRNPSIRQAAFTLLSQNPRQEGIWHAGPSLTNNRYMRRAETGKSNGAKDSAKGSRQASDSPQQQQQSGSGSSVPEDSDDDDDDDDDDDEIPEEVSGAQPAANMRVRGEWVDVRARLRSYAESEWEQWLIPLI